MSPAEATKNYVEHVARRCGETLPSWLQAVGELMVHTGIPSKLVVELLRNSKRGGTYFAVVCAIDAVAIDNLFDAKTAKDLHEALRVAIRELFKGRENWIAEEAMTLMLDMKRTYRDGAGPLPHHVGMKAMMQCLELHKHKETKHLFDDQKFLMLARQPLNLVVMGWWKALSHNSRIERLSR